MPLPPARRTGTALLAAGLLGAALSACSSSGAGHGRPTSAAPAAAGGNPRVATVTITAAQGCRADKQTFPGGAITFKIANKDATAVSEVELLSGERIIGEKENIPPGFAGEFAVTAGAGSYTLYCPGGTPERTTLKVTGHAGAATDAGVAALLTQATKGYARYVETQTAALLATVGTLNIALHGTDLAAAQKAYMQARPFYEKIEPVAESFQIGRDNVDADIDAREGAVPTSQWRGFHRIEKALFQQHTIAGLTSLGTRLVADVKRLQGLCATLTYQPTELANGAQSLLDEVAGSKLTGEEERYSHIDLLDFSNNDEGAEQAFAQLQPALTKIDPVLTKTITTRFEALDALVNKYRTGANPSGFRLNTDLTSADKRALGAAVKAVQEPLSTVASKVANA